MPASLRQCGVQRRSFASRKFQNRKDTKTGPVLSRDVLVLAHSHVAVLESPRYFPIRFTVQTL